MRVAPYAAGILALSAVVCGCAAKQPSVLGRTVAVKMTDHGPDAKGELISVEDGRLLLRDRSGLREIPLAGVREVRVKRHDWDGRRGLTWSAVGGLVTGGALAMSCSAAENDGGACAGLGGAVLGLWMLVGGLSSRDMEHSSWSRLPQPTANGLRPYARFPQGVPAGIDVRDLKPVPGAAPLAPPEPRPSEKPLQLPPSPRK